MRTLQLMVQHNAWCNSRVLAFLAGLQDGQLRDDARGTIGTIEETVKHLAGVEDAYMALIQGQDPTAGDSQEAYFGQPFAWFRARAKELGPAYDGLLSAADPGFLDRPLHVPWIPVELSNREVLIQMLTHSGQHRAQILSTLGDRGLDVAYVDYVVMRVEDSGESATDQTSKA